MSTHHHSAPLRRRLLAAGAMALAAASAAAFATEEPPLQLKLENPGFETHSRQTPGFPVHWTSYGNAQVSLDSTERAEGRRSVKVVGANAEADGGLAQRISANRWNGKKATLTAQFKLAGGDPEAAELWIEVYNDLQLLATEGVSPSAGGWKKVSLTVPVAAEATEIRLGLEVRGKVAVWLDNLNLE